MTCEGGCVLVIVGSRDLAGNAEARALIELELDNHPNFRRFISGGAVGIDKMAEKAARKRNSKAVRVYNPSERKFWGEGGYRERDIWMAEDCEHLVRISSSTTTTYGSGFTADHAESLGKSVTRHVVVR